MNVEAYNFRKPGRLGSDKENRLGGWLRTACALAPAQWNKHLPFAAELELTSLETVLPAEGLARVPEPNVAYRLAIEGLKLTTLLLLPRPLTLTMLAAMLGETLEALPADRELTVVEESLYQYMLQALLFSPLQETWPGMEPLCLQVGAKEPNPKWSRLFPAAENVILCTFRLRGPFGEQEWIWLVPQKGILEPLARLDADQESVKETQSRPRLETVLQELPVEIAVTLGEVELPVSMLASLKEGDVIILNQRLAEPLTASIDGVKRFRGWAGRSGSQQAFQIVSVQEG